MRAAIFHAAGQPVSIETVPDPTPAPDEVVIRVGCCGICGSDIHATSGHSGRILPAGAQLGHEYAGEVVAIGSAVTALRIGDAVAGMPIVGCGRCDGCKTGIDMLCTTWRRYGFNMAEYGKVNQRGMARLPRSVSLADGALVEPLAVGCRGVRLGNPGPGQRILVIGPGPIGLAVVFWLARLGIEAVAVLASSGRRQHLALAMGVGGTSFVVEGPDAPDAVCAALGGPADIIFECAGVPGVLARAIEMIRPQGSIVGLGFCMLPDPILPGLAIMKDVNIRFSSTYTRKDFQDSADVLDQHAALARVMVTDVVSLAQFPSAFEAFRSGQTNGGKLLVDIWRS